MSAPPTLTELLAQAAREHGERTAVVDPGRGRLSHGQIWDLAGRVRDRLASLGVGPGDRVGVWMRKSADSVAAIGGILARGAAYIPVDPGAPPSRNAFILEDAGVAAVIIERRFVEPLRGALAGRPVPPALEVEEPGGGDGLRGALQATRSPAVPTATPAADDLAYVLYTSGSTGTPKGVMLSHRNATSFVDWCLRTFSPTPQDVFSSHAPFHFDLSILDLWASLGSGASVVLVGEEAGKDPAKMVPLIAEHRISIWYSAPSILALLVQHGGIGRLDASGLRLVLFAGEVFPVKHLRALVRLLPAPRYFNLYGPTETNVCTFHEVPREIPEDRTEPYPIGRTCDHLRSRVVSPEGADLPPGQEGELCIAGPAVMQGYWKRPELTEASFLPSQDGERWYRTGDVVVLEDDGVHRFVGRRDRMVKRRGYRIELGEIEAGLYGHPAVREAAVIALQGEDGVRIKAFVGVGDGRRPSLIEIKRFCAERLPLYMVPDQFSFQGSLPKTSTDKIDYQRLRELD